MRAGSQTLGGGEAPPPPQLAPPCTAAPSSSGFAGDGVRRRLCHAVREQDEHVATWSLRRRCRCAVLGGGCACSNEQPPRLPCAPVPKSLLPLALAALCLAGGADPGYELVFSDDADSVQLFVVDRATLADGLQLTRSGVTATAKDLQRRVIAAAVAAGACAAATTAATPVAPPKAAHPKVARASLPPVTGGTSPHRVLLRRIVRDVTAPRIASIRLGAPPRAFRRFRGAWLYFKIPTTNTVRDVIQAYWQVATVTGVAVVEARRRGLQPIVGEDITLVLPSRQERFASSGPENALSAVAPTAPRDLISAVYAAARRSKLVLKDVKVDTLLGHHAVRIMAITKSPRSFLAGPYSEMSLEMRMLTKTIDAPVVGPPLADGTYVEVRDPMGVWVATEGYSSRLTRSVGGPNPSYPRRTKSVAPGRAQG